MKKILLCFLILMSGLSAGGQSLPTDQAILHTIFGETDSGGDSWSRPFTAEEVESSFSYEDQVTFRVAFKARVELEAEEFLLAILQAPFSTLHGHQMGYRKVYFLQEEGGRLTLADSVLSEGEIPLGDALEWRIEEIGRGHKALVSVFQSTGNHHFERGEYLELLEKGKLSHLLAIDSEYSNAAWMLPQTEDAECEASSSAEVYTILEADKEWYDVLVRHIDYGFTKGCKEEYVVAEKDRLYGYRDGEYVELSKSK